MKYLLFGGAPNVGKSECIYRLAVHLKGMGFSDLHLSVPATFSDFRAVLEGLDKTGMPVHVIVNSATDTPDLIDDFKDFYDQNGAYDILISSVRDDNFWPRDDFFSTMGINPSSPDLVEVPLAKVTRRNYFPVALSWYSDKLDKLSLHLLSNPPFNLL